MKPLNVLAIVARPGILKRIAISVANAATWCFAFLIFSSAPAEAATCATMRPFRNAALLVGISNPWLQEGPRPLKFAGADAADLAPIFEKQFNSKTSGDVFVLKDAQATTANITTCLDALATYALNDAKVVIFISARGFASPQLDDGFVITYDSAMDKLPHLKGGDQVGNGIAIRTVRQKLEAMKNVTEKYLLLDLCRYPAETPNLDNLINKKVIDKKFLDRATRQILLASTGSQWSFEPPDSKNGHGYYAGSLIEVLQPGIKFQDLFEKLKKNVEDKTEQSHMKQVPDRPAAPPNDRNPCLLCTLSQNRSIGPLLASLLPVAFFQDPPPGSSDEDQRLLGKAADEEEKGQQTFVRYGQGNHFSGDPFHECENPTPEFLPFRLCGEEYTVAAEHFQQAAMLRGMISGPKPEGNQKQIKSLQERARFCRAQVLLLSKDWASAVAVLEDPSHFQFAESHNVLGIAYLEQSMYPEAQEQFMMAIEKAPYWAYPRHNLALAYVEHGNYSAAEKQYTEAIRWTPIGEKRPSQKDNPCFHGRQVIVTARPYLYYNLAVLLQRLNRLREAKQQYCLAEESFLMELERFGEDAGSGDEADQRKMATLRSIAGKSNLADVENSLGVLFESLNKRMEAMTYFRKAYDSNSGLIAASFNIARLEASNTKNVKAQRQSYEKVLELPACQKAADELELACRAAQTELDKLQQGSPK